MPLLLTTDETDFEVTGIFERRERLRQHAGRRSIDRPWGFLAQRFVRPFVVVLRAKTIEPRLLGLQIPGRRVRADPDKRRNDAALSDEV